MTFPALEVSALMICSDTGGASALSSRSKLPNGPLLPTISGRMDGEQRSTAFDAQPLGSAQEDDEPSQRPSQSTGGSGNAQLQAALRRRDERR